MAGPSPIEINHIRAQGVVRVTWDDGHVGEYSEAHLRGYCPCAGCQGHGGDIKFIYVPDVKLAGISAVGNYAIMPRWQDGHETGIYTFEYLRHLCPCAECQSAAGESQT